MKFRVEVICVNDEGTEQRQDVMEMEAATSWRWRPWD